MEKISVLTFPDEFKVTMDLGPGLERVFLLDDDELGIELLFVFQVLVDVAPVIGVLEEPAADESEQTARANDFDFDFFFFSFFVSFRSEVNCSR